jgi:pyruvate formate lyase activating enzyme
MTQLFKENNNRLECLLCPHYCKLSKEGVGICGVRKNTGKKIELITYGVISGFSLDPVEKKPLYHFYPGYNILSAGSYGCNMRCDFCQNFNISQNVPELSKSKMTTDNLLNAARSAVKNIGIAFTYNEPIVGFEFMMDVAESARNIKLKTVMVSNGYVNSEPLGEIIQVIDAFNIDLKAFTDNFYRKLAGARLQPVLETLKQIGRSGKHLEITTLIIPGQNDSEKEMTLQSEWIAGELGRKIPFHLSRYFPMYRREDPATSTDTLTRLFEIASEKLDYVYMGNTHLESGQNTVCPECGSTVTIRMGYETTLLNLDNSGKCTECGTLIYKNFKLSSQSES